MSLIFHIPVLLSETLEFLKPQKGQVFVDCTLGGGGHSEDLLKSICPEGKLIGIDQDPEAIEESQKRLKSFTDQIIFVQDNFVNLRNILGKLGIWGVDGILFDLGVSTHQLETPSRGFSFGLRGKDAPLDMRMSSTQPLRAYDIVNFYSENGLREIFFKLGEEPFGGRIAREIIKAREKKLLEKTGELLEVIKRALSPKYRFSREHGHWASKIFRALRMEVNQELPALEQVLPQALNVLKSGGRLVVISFHSLEDRIVKHQFLEWQQSGLVEILTKKPITPTAEEITQNPRSESAKLRAVRKV